MEFVKGKVDALSSYISFHKLKLVAYLHMKLRDVILYHMCTDCQLYFVKWLGTLREYRVI